MRSRQSRPKCQWLKIQETVCCLISLSEQKSLQRESLSHKRHCNFSYNFRLYFWESQTTDPCQDPFPIETTTVTEYNLLCYLRIASAWEIMTNTLSYIKEARIPSCLWACFWFPRASIWAVVRNSSKRGTVNPKDVYRHLVKGVKIVSMSSS